MMKTKKRHMKELIMYAFHHAAIPVKGDTVQDIDTQVTYQDVLVWLSEIHRTCPICSAFKAIPNPLRRNLEPLPFPASNFCQKDICPAAPVSFSAATRRASQTRV